MQQPVFFERPDAPGVTLRTAPRLADWNRAGDAGGARLVRSLSISDAVIDPLLAACDGPVALRFDVGLHRAVRLLDERDLDNYLLPLTAHLRARSAGPVVSVWGCKRYADATTLHIDTARPRDDDGFAGSPTTVLRVTAAGERDDFKVGFRQQVRDLAAGYPALPDGPVVLELAFVVGPGRDWLDLWGATIDGLGPLLGQLPSQPEFHPRDGRIVDLGLHRAEDPELGDDVVIGLRAHAGWLDPVPADAPG